MSHKSHIKTIGHRGAGFLEPENTIRGMKRAIELRLDYVEFDVRRCKSGKLIVIHDASVDRTTNGKGFVKDIELKQLQMLDAGKGEKIPALHEVIDTCKGKIKMYIELKEKGLEEDVVDTIISNNVIGDVMVKSFFHECSKRVKEVAIAKSIKLETGILIAGNPINIIEVATSAKADFVSANHVYTDERMVSLLKNKGIGITVWNCDTERDVQRAIKLGVEMIGSNKPDLLIEVLRRQ